jgi:hypothetical protein
MSLTELIFVRRQSPDWAGLARDYEAAIPIDPSRFVPHPVVPGFPNNIADCIQVWNALFPVNFFRCRQVLSAIAEHCLHQVRNARVVPLGAIDQIPTMVMRSAALVFFTDDDDWFNPKVFELLAGLDPGQSDIVVFPLVRLGEDSFTFVRKGEPARVVVGRRRDFGHRFQTNNYGITARTALSRHFQYLKDHVLGSVYADQQDLLDGYFDMLISATSKTPCSANLIGELPSDPAAYRAFIRRYVDNLERLAIPAELHWMTEPLSKTVALFQVILSGPATSAGSLYDI